MAQALREPHYRPPSPRQAGYSVKELYLTIQGEGANTGRAAVFLRFSGCNLWSGREEDRATAACRFCDTDFVGRDGIGGGRFTSASELAERVRSVWPRDDRGDGPSRPFVVCTGGEPLLQLDEPLVAALHEQGFNIATETNGTITPPRGIDWICVSPKAGTQLVVVSGQELKLVYPQSDLDPSSLEHLAFERFYLQPKDGPHREKNTQAAVRYCLEHPKWSLSLQAHKLIGIP